MYWFSVGLGDRIPGLVGDDGKVKTGNGKKINVGNGGKVNVGNDGKRIPTGASGYGSRTA